MRGGNKGDTEVLALRPDLRFDSAAGMFTLVVDPLLIEGGLFFGRAYSEPCTEPPSKPVISDASAPLLPTNKKINFI